MLIVLKSNPAHACVHVCVRVRAGNAPGSWGGGGGASGPDAIHS